MPAPLGNLDDATSGIGRREWIRLGGLGLGSLGMTDLLAWQSLAATADPTFGRAKACIVLFITGGPPQHETFDPKPDAPAEIRADFKPISTSVPGRMIGELMPRTARLLHRISVLRAVATDDNAHSSSGYYMLTGRPHAPKNFENARKGFPNDWPPATAILRALRSDQQGVPSSIVLPDNIWNDGNIAWPGQEGGRLGRAADPWLLRCEPEKQNFSIPGISLPEELSADRLSGRLSLLHRVNEQTALLERLAEVRQFDTWSEQALGLLKSGGVQRAFDLAREPQSLREKYGSGQFGQSVLLARRLVEAGVPLVQVNWTRIPGKINNGGWDTHQKHAEAVRTVLMDPMDAAYATLIEDLADRGMLDETLVIWAGEFGRNPRFNGMGGRDHWGHVFSAALAGGGVKEGAVHGLSDRIGAYPVDGRVGPEDLIATMFHLLGHDPQIMLSDQQGRPFPACEGSVIRSILH